MANFSGGSGYMPIMAMFGAIASLPATVFLWAGMALPLRTEDGKLDYQILSRRLRRVALPICLVLFALLAWICITTVYGNIWAFMPASIWGAAFPTLGMYCSLLLSAKILAGGSHFSKGKWLPLAVGFIAVIAVVGWLLLMFVLEPLGSSLDR